MRKIVIIGNGISGITCARHIRKNCDDAITIISSETEHFFSRTALMYIYMGHMKYEHTKPYEDFFWKKNKLDLLQDTVIKIDTGNKQLHTKSKKNIAYDILIIATGSVTKKYNWPGQDLKGVVGLYSYPDLQQLEIYSKDIKNAVIVGGGLIGVELAEMLYSRNIEVTMLVKEKYYWSSVLPKPDAKLIGDHVSSHGINILYQTELKSINGKDDKVDSVTTSGEVNLDTPLVCIATGVAPNISFLQNSGIETDKGVLINKYFETNVKDVYALGDCAQFKEAVNGRKNIEQVWYTGRMHGEVLAQTLCGSKTAYSPGPWFNSAKFFDIEFQMYGKVLSELKDPQEKYFHWKSAEKEISLTAVYNTNTKIFIGLNSFGLRLRHECFDQWLRENATIDFVMQNFNKAIFNKEFEKDYVSEIIDSYNKATGAAIVYKKKKRFSFF
jgi:3-phenylpropionate/trans-cinnamate dioxygenase ferredoxin reductase subunit